MAFKETIDIRTKLRPFEHLHNLFDGSRLVAISNWQAWLKGSGDMLQARCIFLMEKTVNSPGLDYDDDYTWLSFTRGAYKLDPAPAGDLELARSSCRGKRTTHARLTTDTLTCTIGTLPFSICTCNWVRVLSEAEIFLAIGTQLLVWVRVTLRAAVPKRQ